MLHVADDTTAQLEIKSTSEKVERDFKFHPEDLLLHGPWVMTFANIVLRRRELQRPSPQDGVDVADVIYGEREGGSGKERIN